MEVGEREIIYLSLHCHHQNDSCIKMGSDESHFNVSLIVRDKVTRQCPETTIFEEKGEPNRFEPRSLCLPALCLTARPNRLTTLESVGRKIYIAHLPWIEGCYIIYTPEMILIWKHGCVSLFGLKCWMCDKFLAFFSKLQIFSCEVLIDHHL